MYVLTSLLPIVKSSTAFEKSHLLSILTYAKLFVKFAIEWRFLFFK